MDVTVPFLERRSIDSCMLPPMSGSMHALPLNKNTFVCHSSYPMNNHLPVG